MNLNRPLIKQQARELIKGQVFKLFIISFIVSLCASIASGLFFGITSTYNISRGYDYSGGDLFDDGYNGDYFGSFDDDSDYFNGFDGDTEGWDFYHFGGSMSVIPTENEAVPAEYNFTFSIGNNYAVIPYIIAVFLSPLTVALMGFYVSFVRGKRYEIDDGIKTVFKNAFKVCYFKKMGVFLLEWVIEWLLTLLFIIPGIIFSYSAYFAFQIVCDYPELSPWQAIKLSKKIVKGNRWELFVLDLSFLPWVLLCVFIFPIIYVLPYIRTTMALYYENFRLRAIQEGRVTEDDFLSDAQRFAKYSAAGAAPNMNNSYYQPYGAPQQSTYYNPIQQAPQQSTYYNPVQQAPQQPGMYYNYPIYNPVQQAAPPEPQAAPNEPPVPQTELQPESIPETQEAPETAEPISDENTEI